MTSAVTSYTTNSLSAPTSAQLAASTTSDAFAGWPLSVQASFVRQNGSGTPPQIVIGPSGETQVVASLLADGTVDTAAVPSGFSTAPAALTYPTFASWPDEVQALYVKLNGSGGSLVVGTGTGQVTTTLASSGLAVSIVANSAYPASSQISAAAFFALPQSAQEALYNSLGGSILFLGTYSGQPYAQMDLKLDDGNTISVQLPTSNGQFTNFPGFETAPTTSGNDYVVQDSGYPYTPTTTRQDEFASWPPQVQKAYLLKAAGTPPTYPITVLFNVFPPDSYPGANIQQFNGYSAILTSATSDVVFTANPTGFSNAVSTTYNDGQTRTSLDAPDPDTFLKWPLAAQIAYFKIAASNGSLGLKFGSTPTSPDPADLTVTMASDGSGLQFQLTSWSQSYRSDPTLFAILSPADQLSYFNANKSGNPPSCLIGSGSTLLTLASDGSVVAQACPTGFSTSPSSLTAQTFLSWTEEARTAYVGLNGGSVAIGDALTASIAAGGSLQVTVPIPYENPPGVTSQAVVDTANLLFPVTVANPSSVAPASLDPATFEAWTSAQQVAYIQANATTSSPSLHIAGTSASGASAIDVFLGTAGSTSLLPPVYTVQNLQKTDIAKMSFADQKVLAGISAFQAIASGLGLIPADDTDATATVDGLIESSRLQILDSALPQKAQAVFLAEIDLIRSNLLGAPVPQPTSYLNSYGLLLASQLEAPTPITSALQTGGSAIFSTTDIQAALTAITQRCTRAAAFATVANNTIVPSYSSVTLSGHIAGGVYDSTSDTTTFTNPDANGNVVGIIPVGSPLESDPYGQPLSGSDLTVSAAPTSTVTIIGPDINGLINQPFLSYTYTTSTGHDASVEGNSAIISGYANFMTQETAIMNNAYNARSLATTGQLNGSNQHLDLPDLLCLYQIYNNNTEQAIISADTEEVNQANAILKDYAGMQQIVNATVATSTNNANDSLKIVIGNANGNLPYMFQSNYGYVESPIEQYYFGNSFSRPTLNGLSNSTSLTSSNWTQFGTELGDAVTQLNQSSQIKMNDLTSETKQQDRYFDLASTALSKLNETLTQIASAT